MNLGKWGAGEPISAAKLNAMRAEALRSRGTEIVGPGSVVINDVYSTQGAHHVKPQVQLCKAMEDFGVMKLSPDLYETNDTVQSGMCLLQRLNTLTGAYAQEIGFAQFRVWDPFNQSIKSGDVFFAVQNRDSQRLEALPTIPRPLEGITRKCLGDGWWEVEVGEFKGQPNALYCYSPNASEDEECDLCELTQISSQDGAEPCQTASVSIEWQRPIPKKEYVYAHDARRIPLKKDGHVRVMFSHYSDCGDPLFFVINGEYEMVKIAFPDYECCDGVVIQTGCKYVIVEGVECETIEPYTPGCP